MSGLLTRRFNGVLGLQSFRWFWLGQVVSQLGDAFGDVALPVLVYVRTGSTTVMAMLMVASMLPNLLVSPWSGILADRLDRKAILLSADIGRALLVALVPWFAATWQFVACWFLLTALKQFFEQGRFGLIPGIVPKEKLVHANLFSQSSAQVISLAGPGIAGALIALIGTTPAFYVDALSFLLSALCVWRIPATPLPQREAFSLRREVTEGWDVIRKNPALCFSAALVAIAMIGAMPINVLRVPFLIGTLGANATFYGLAISAFSGAALLGTTLGGWLVKRINRIDLILYGMIATAFSALLYAASPGIIVAIAAFGLVGLLNGVVNPLNASLVQEQTPHGFHGRVWGWYTAVCTVISLVSSSVAGSLGERYGVREVLLGGALLYVIGSVAGFVLPWYRPARQLYVESESRSPLQEGSTI